MVQNFNFNVYSLEFQYTTLFFDMLAGQFYSPSDSVKTPSQSKIYLLKLGRYHILKQVSFFWDKTNIFKFFF